MIPQDTPTPAAHPWDAVAHLPEGRALIDAHLETRSALSELIVLVQSMAAGASGTPASVHARAQEFLPLFDGPGRSWTDRYWQLNLAAHNARSALQEHVTLLARGKNHSWLPETALKRLNAVCWVSGQPVATPVLTADAPMLATIDRLLKATEGHSRAPWVEHDLVVQSNDETICRFDFLDEENRTVTPLFWQENRALVLAAPEMREVLEELRSALVQPDPVLPCSYCLQPTPLDSLSEKNSDGDRACPLCMAACDKEHDHDDD